jgi:hypothetical protein
VQSTNFQRTEFAYYNFNPLEQYRGTQGNLSNVPEAIEGAGLDGGQAGQMSELQVADDLAGYRA